MSDESIEQKIIAAGGVMLTEPLMTEEGFLNPACMNQLEAALEATPKTWQRLRDDQEWTVPRITSLKDITGAFAMYAVKQSPYDCPADLETVVGYLAACLRRRIPWDEVGFAQLSLCEINRHLHETLYEQGVKQFDAWNERKNKREGMGFCSAMDKPSPDDDFIDLDALLRNVCLAIRSDRREFDAFNERFERETATAAPSDGGQEEKGETTI